MKNQYKNKGISILIAMGGSFLVLMIAFGTLLSISKMLAQMESLERSTKLFFAAESGIEAAFYHHNARGVGVDFGDIEGVASGSSQTIDHLNGTINSTWTIQGRSALISGTYPIIGLLREGQTVQIPLSWDSVGAPQVNAVVASIGGLPATTDYFKLEFYNDSNNMIALEKAEFEKLFGERVEIPNNFDFGKDNADGYEILIDWSVSRIHDSKGIQVFSPKENDCTIQEDFICEDMIYSGVLNTPSDSIDASTTAITERKGRVLPGYTTANTTLTKFMTCDDDGPPPNDAAAGGNCSNYILTFRPLLKFTHTSDGSKIPGIPYIVRGYGGGAMLSIPKQSYTVEAVVSEGDFSQRVSIEVPEKTSIGAFDYVIFD